MKQFNLENSPFAILGVPEDANDEQIKRAYRRMALKHHPDRSKEANAEKQFKRVQLCYQLLKSPASRAAIRQIIELQRSRGKRQRYGRSAYRGSPYKGFGGTTTVAVPSKPSLGEYLRKLWLELWLGASITFRTDRVPLKMLFFVPFMIASHAFNNGAQPLGHAQVLLAVTQGFVGAWVADLISQFAMQENRWVLRLKINNLFAFIFMAGGILLIARAYLHLAEKGIAIRKNLEELLFFDLALVWELTTIAMLAGLALWVVFCFLFDRHKPYWEAVTVCLATAMIEYIVVF